MEDLVSDQIFGIINDAASSLQELTALQATYFRQNKWSQSTPDRATSTLTSMLTILDRNRKQTSDIYYYTYPSGTMFGYVYPDDDVTRPVQMVTQDSKTLAMSFWMCDPTGLPIAPPVFSFPGTNITEALLPGGSFKANIDYSNKTWSGFTSIFVASGQLLKSSLQIAVNPVTKTMGFVSGRLSKIANAIPYPLFAGFLDVNSGSLVASSDPSITFLTSDGLGILPLTAVNNSFAQDLSIYFLSSYPANNSQSQMVKFVATMDQAKRVKMYVDRNVNGENWMLELKVMSLLGQRFIFAVYMNVDFVESDIKTSGQRTGFMMLGIILAFLLLGGLFSWTIASQLGLVAKQIDLLKQLKFSEVLDREDGVKGRSFIFELADLQQAFFEMATAFAQSLKASMSVRGVTQSSQAAKKSDVASSVV
ncbi:hypothetical protein BCR33DRAFT_766231 [Rhizoclosmatium globosum]|uniref:Uncharacterized protein n=1 Tax=Rhizoclosmatium globosum TaxID=329046 RepID=A0A1Y2CB02_9FUNG|nr:hypothetical protein BCR33DRAFT_766231 [Rhizoclosmatium globosum]|eukprot:ORY44077.1 hypothetical protein BCR33DRAFT_766231 [Rhizoclosmatium globosum]